MLIKNTKAKAFHIPDLKNRDGDVVPGKTIIPGVNRVSDALWAEALKHKIIEIHVENGDLVEVETKGGKKKIQGPEELDEKAALALIKDTLDPALLEEWAETAKGAKAKGIAAQLEMLKQKAPTEPVKK